jgi:hypothetical protein
MSAGQTFYHLVHIPALSALVILQQASVSLGWPWSVILLSMPPSQMRLQACTTIPVKHLTFEDTEDPWYPWVYG